MADRADDKFALLREIHGRGKCSICGEFRVLKGKSWCSYPHAMLPAQPMDPAHPDGFWAWERTDVTR